MTGSEGSCSNQKVANKQLNEADVGFLDTVNEPQHVTAYLRSELCPCVRNLPPG